MGLKVLIADDHELFRMAIRALVADTLGVTELQEAASLDQALEVISEGEVPDLLTVDFNMPGVAGMESIAALIEAFPTAKVVILSASEDQDAIFDALRVGVRGYIPKSLPASQIEAALKDVLSGRIYMPATIGRRSDPSPMHAAASAPASIDELTSRQKDVLNQLLKGQSNKEIVRSLGIAEGTVKIHLAAIYRSLRVRSRAEAIAKLAEKR